MNCLLATEKCKQIVMQLIMGKSPAFQRHLLREVAGKILLILPRHCKNKWRPFEEAREFVRSLQLSTTTEWKKWSKSERPSDIPTNPREVYRGEWVSMKDWIGSSYSRKRHNRPPCKWRPFEEAREFARSLRLSGIKEWVEFSKSGKRPSDIPSCPWREYHDKWVNMRDWVGSSWRRAVGSGQGRKCRQWRHFEEAKVFARGLGLKNKTEWQSYCRGEMEHLPARPNDIPTVPTNYYSEYVSMADWLGMEVRPCKKVYEEARAFVHTLKLECVSEWRAYCRTGNRPADIPACPERTYRGCGWINWRDWIGKPIRQRKAT